MIKGTGRIDGPIDIPTANKAYNLFNSETELINAYRVAIQHGYLNGGINFPTTITEKGKHALHPAKHLGSKFIDTDRDAEAIIKTAKQTGHGYVTKDQFKSFEDEDSKFNRKIEKEIVDLQNAQRVNKTYGTTRAITW